MSEKLGSLEVIGEALLALGYEAKLGEQSVAVLVRGRKAVLTIDDIQNQLVFSCAVTNTGSIHDDQEAELGWRMLQANSRVRPFAFALVTGDGSEPDNWPVVLEDSVPLGDFDVSELDAAMNSLQSALVVAEEVLAQIS